jgi:hypothetical protein
VALDYTFMYCEFFEGYKPLWDIFQKRNKLVSRIYSQNSVEPWSRIIDSRIFF